MKTKGHYYSIPENAVDPDTSTVKGVSLMTIGDAAGHFDDEGRQEVIDATTIQQVFDQCKALGTIKVKANHGSGVMETIGWMDNFEISGDKVIGDFHIYDSEPNKPRILEIASKNPHHFGMSMEFIGANQIAGGKALARCEEIVGVALVSDAAANKSLFSIPQTETNPTKMDPEETEKTPTTEEKLDQLLSKFDEVESRFAALEGVGATDKELSDPDKTVADDKKDEPADDDKAEYSDEKLAKFAKSIAAETVKAFAATIGVTQLGKPGARQEKREAEETWPQLVAKAATELKCDLVKAEAHLLGKLSDPAVMKAYSAQRLVKTS